jgi:phosphatidate cytidylyltransferase
MSQEKFKLANLSQRAVTAAILVPVMLIITYIGGLTYIIFSIVLCALSVRELVSMVKKDKKHWRIFYYGGIFFISFFSMNLISIRSLGLSYSIFLLVIVWITDTAGYFCGIHFGGKKLAPKISPGKTWSGFVGALVISGIVGGILHMVQFVQLSNNILMSILSTIFISFCSQGGDLAESALKRYFEVKDSGDILPGHGGLLDRFDGMIFASFALVGLISN